MQHTYHIVSGIVCNTISAEEKWNYENNPQLAAAAGYLHTCTCYFVRA